MVIFLCQKNDNNMFTSDWEVKNLLKPLQSHFEAQGL